MTTIVTRAGKGSPLTNTEMDTNLTNLNSYKVEQDISGNATITGDVYLTGSGKRITGDFSNATIANRVMFQTSTVNGNTAVGVLPNGTASTSTLLQFNNSDPTNSGFGGIQVTSSLVNFLSGITGTGTYLPMTFFTGGAERMRIDTSGNVGIGTSSPGSIKLKIATDTAGYALQTVGSVNDYYGMSIYNSNSGSSAKAYLQLGNNTSQYQTFISVNSSTNTDFGGANALNIVQGGSAPIAFATSNTERMRIDSSGNLLIGSSGITGINGSGRVRVVSSTPGTANGYALSTYDSVNYYALQCVYGASQVGTISVTSSSTAYNTSSDYRLKENIQPMQNALAVVQQLNPVTYTWKADGSDGQGFIAHELQAVVPDCVTGEKDAVDADGNPVYQGIDTSFLVATLVAAIQELKSDFDAYKATHP